MPNRSQIIKIHIAKQQLGLTDDEYRDILSAFVTYKGSAAQSCKDLSEAQAEVLLNRFKSLGWQEKRKNKVLEYEELWKRDPKFANPKQLRMIKGLWKSKSREKTDRALNSFIYRIAERSDITMILKTDVQKIVKAIRSLK